MMFLLDIYITYIYKCKDIKYEYLYILIEILYTGRLVINYLFRVLNAPLFNILIYWK